MQKLVPIHIGVIVKDIEKAMEYYTETFQVGPWNDFGQLNENAEYYGKKHVLSYRAASAPFGPINLELIQPTGGESVFMDALKEQGEGIHHVCVQVDDIEKAEEEWKALGFEIVDKVPMYEMEPGFSLGFFFTNPDKHGNIRFEVVQEVITETKE